MMVKVTQKWIDEVNEDRRWNDRIFYLFVSAILYLYYKVNGNWWILLFAFASWIVWVALFLKDAMKGGDKNGRKRR